MPEFGGEFRALVRVIYLASAPDEVDAARFDGASSYRLWGGLVLNVDDDKSDLEMLETLAHEAGHCFLFGLTVSEPLTRSDGRVFQSPLRTDARPLDGIYHATYVSARMHAVVLAAKESGILSGTQMLEADKLLQASARAFYGGDSVLRGEPGVTPLGESILEWARAFMNAAAPEAAAAS